LPSRTKVKKANIQEEQLEVLKKILAEMQTLNANIASIAPRSSPPVENILSESGRFDDEELEDYE
jgi:hypothetical protein